MIWIQRNLLLQVRAISTPHSCANRHLEKMLKAVFLALNKGDEPPRTHNLLFLLDRLGLDSIPESVSKISGRLTAYYIETRYPDYKEKLSKLVDHAEAQEILKRTKEVMLWMESLLPSQWR